MFAYFHTVTFLLWWSCQFLFPTCFHFRIVVKPIFNIMTWPFVHFGKHLQQFYPHSAQTCPKQVTLKTIFTHLWLWVHSLPLVSANTRSHQLLWGHREMGTAISCIECSQVACLIQKSADTSRKHRLFVQLFFMQLSFIQKSCIVIVIVDRHVLLVHNTCVRARIQVLEVPEVI